MTAPEAVVYAALVGALASVLGYFAAGSLAVFSEWRKQRREERYRIAFERRTSYADFSKELRRLIPVGRSRPYGMEHITDFDPLESAHARVVTLGSSDVSKAADEAREAVIIFRIGLSQMGFFKRVELKLEKEARDAVRSYEKICREEVNRAE